MDVDSTSMIKPADEKNTNGIKTDKLKQRLWDIFASGLPADYHLEALRKIILLNLMFLLGSFFLIVLGTIEFILQDFLLGFVNFSFFVFGKKFEFSATYDFYLKLRFIPTYITIFLLAFVVEKTREIFRGRLESAKFEIKKSVGELEQANKSLRESEIKYRTFFNTSRDCISLYRKRNWPGFKPVCLWNTIWEMDSR